MSGRYRAAVLGHPIDHSLSPVLHRAAYAELGLTGWAYTAHDVTEASFAAFWGTLDQTWAGLSLTMPLKRVVRAHLATVSPLAEAVGAVNTVTFGPEGARGDNTDVHGIVAALAEVGVIGVQPGAVPVVLGGGATAASALGALAQLGAVRVGLLVRAPERSTPVADVAERLGLELIIRRFDDEFATPGGALLGAEVPLVVSTLPAAAAAAQAEGVRAVLTRTAPPLLDVVYDPWPSPLAALWQAAGVPVANGFSMLLHQASAQVRLMTGQAGPLAAMRRAGEGELARRAGA